MTDSSDSARWVAQPRHNHLKATAPTPMALCSERKEANKIANFVATASKSGGSLTPDISGLGSTADIAIRTLAQQVVDPPTCSNTQLEQSPVGGDPVGPVMARPREGTQSRTRCMASTRVSTISKKTLPLPSAASGATGIEIRPRLDFASRWLRLVARGISFISQLRHLARRPRLRRPIPRAST